MAWSFLIIGPVILVALGLVVIGSDLLPSRVWLAIWSTVMVAANLLVWAVSGGSVIGTAVWAIPAVLIALSVMYVWTNTIGMLISWRGAAAARCSGHLRARPPAVWLFED